MSLIVAVSWAVALAVAVVLLGFCAYELRWKLARLRTDLEGLDALKRTLAQVRADAESTSLRASQLTSVPLTPARERTALRSG